MMVGIEAMNFYGGTAYLNVDTLAKHRNLDNERFSNLLMREKTVALPHEDVISFAVNAAKPIVDALSEEDKNRIEMVVTCTESGIDFGKSISTYVHDYLGLSRYCRLFEVKNACYSGTVGFQNAVNFILSNASPGAKALVIATDMVKFQVAEGGEKLSADWSFAEPSSGGGAIAMLISNKPYVYQVDVGANCYYGYEVMDTCRPIPDSEAGDSDLSLMSYLDCYQSTVKGYLAKVANVDYRNTFDYLVFHTPFGGMIKGAHRSVMKKLFKEKQNVIDQDFNKRVMPGLTYCQRVGNVMGATVFLSMLSTIANGNYDVPRRLGCFSYGSGCCSEFYSGVVTADGQKRVKDMKVKEHLDQRYELNMDEYEKLLRYKGNILFGTRNAKVDLDFLPNATNKSKGRLVLSCVNEFHREYVWL